MRELPAIYSSPTKLRPSKKYIEEEAVVQRALEILHRRLRKPGIAQASSPGDAIDMIKLALAEEEREVFGVLLLDNKHRMIAFERLFSGTIDGAAVYPREVVKRALKRNAAAVIFAHNHPSGVPTESAADKEITSRLEEALALIGVRVLDHIIVGGMSHVSFAAEGLI